MSEQPPMTEYERMRSCAEAEAIHYNAMTCAGFRHARDAGRRLCASVGLSPERVYNMTAHMRVKANGGAR